MSQHQRRPARPLLTIGLANVFLGLGGVLSDGSTPRWVGAIFIIAGAVAIAVYVDRTITWFERLCASLAIQAHDPISPAVPDLPPDAGQEPPCTCNYHNMSGGHSDFCWHSGMPAGRRA